MISVLFFIRVSFLFLLFFSFSLIKLLINSFFLRHVQKYMRVLYVCIKGMGLQINIHVERNFKRISAFFFSFSVTFINWSIDEIALKWNQYLFRYYDIRITALQTWTILRLMHVWFYLKQNRACVCASTFPLHFKITENLQCKLIILERFAYHAGTFLYRFKW